VSNIRDTDRTSDAGDRSIWYERQEYPIRRHYDEKTQLTLEMLGEKGGHDEVVKDVG
jgi:hypothetical protein